MRFFRELFRPSLKCDRLGHVATECTFRVIAKPERYGWLSGVADSAKMARTQCKRCRAVLSDPIITDREPIHSLSMPQSHHERLEANGYLIR